jgi:hypothetical protein
MGGGGGGGQKVCEEGVDLMAGKEQVTAATAICRACAKLGSTALYVYVYCPSACVLVQDSLLYRVRQANFLFYMNIYLYEYTGCGKLTSFLYECIFI